ncbi:hypothetical protein Cni_G25184 [Canna indica]|uniref:Fe2OG dioxygenase domain-containing protein n=1 Tax=Canna indica TaxID=4628 RepID=A0AAQ3L3V1_9LILI|nr:hypothetical protein Cni_G25184 [Canna indica]
MKATPASTGTAMVVSEAYAKDPMIVWFRGEFAAANAIIDELCGHLAQIGGDTDEYEPVFAAIHRRRLNWLPVLHMQKYHPIAEVAAALRLVTANRAAESPAYELREETEQSESAVKNPADQHDDAPAEDEPAAEEAADDAASVAIEEKAAAAPELVSAEDSSDHKVVFEDGEANGGCQEEQASQEKMSACADHEDVEPRPERIKILKGFMAKESIKGHMVNVVKGLKLYEEIFTDSELLEFSEFINELRLAGRKGELSGETFILFNKEVKGNKREIIQLGTPLFQSATEEAASNIEPIPPALQNVIDRLIQWRLLPESRKPNSCIVNFFDEDEHSQPYYKPPHLDNPLSALILSETTMAFGRSLVSDHDGNYKGSLTLSIKEGSLLVMRGNSADMARHVVSSSPNRRVIITLMKVKPTNHVQVDSPKSTKAMAIWQPGTPPSQKVPAASVLAWPPYGMIPATAAWGFALPSPVVMLAPRKAAVASPGNKKTSHSGTGAGTGVFLPWMVGPKKHNRNLPPRFQKARLLALPSPVEAQA